MNSFLICFCKIFSLLLKPLRSILRKSALLLVREYTL